ncbi:AAA family ATPase [Sphingobacterium spiritivorum]|uniref:RecF/RecN/SMC N-terminal domain protein n=1 Tax=Sphingobacterium spiritivorum ATCC 33861 TaxID=525373 RepID=D7VGG6_SPHSI|nr:AAA family ATPase [Sphingobacterium spiritivorum]EFK60141.1 RecF/RecN/SMC N-terminal domain protein [Sphingobacterium spiritivorum ATCC 33861]QQT34847.1 AAA family ATPase [Sphingobacterium spiritivorum]WQD35737.1 AAA family ATPase [Sphingobacterium spiritivorum]SUJ01774.1 recombination protein F [Sphingobacterium spiritivorum]
MLNVNIVQNEVYNLLIKHWQKDPSFRFTFRKSNRGSRLDKGYWFYGNEWYLAVSFWTGMDWKNKTPNIIFIIHLESGNTCLEINTSDSDEKRRFITQFFVNELGLQSNGIRYQKYYQGNYLECLENFIKTDKVLIDNIILEHAKSFFPIIKNGIFFIEAADFEGQKEKIDRYREDILIENSIETQKPIKISEIEIVNYGPIKNLQINEIPFSSQWIFFTGENGTGKTSILRAIATAICNQKIQVSGFEDENAEISLKLFLSSSDTITYLYPYNQTLENDTFPLTHGFAAYGQSRLKTTHGLDSKNLEFISTELTSSLFNDETHLIDLQYQFDIWRSQQRIRFDKRENYITEILTDILPNLYDIKFDDQIDGVSVTTYIEKDHENAEFAKVTFNKLASGLKSMIAMIGDILIRLYNQQPDVNDPSEFTGIVLIDEIDIHLHPKLQKQIVQQLSKTFPKVQFIASTHSPISFLGAPKNSQIFRVERNSAEGVKIRRLDELLELGDLLPNTILTSPIFGLDDIIPESHDQKKLVRTETNYSEIEFNDIVQKRISSFITDEKEQQLINLFKSRRQ